MIYTYEGTTPAVSPSAWVAPDAVVLGDVEIGEDSSIWYGTVVRGDDFHIRIGARTNIQDLSLLHITSGLYPCIVGDDVTVGHRAILHGCTVENGALIGMGAIVMDQAVVGEGAMVAAGALVTPGTIIPPGKVAMGSPAKVARDISEVERGWVSGSAPHYAEIAKKHALCNVVE